MTVYSFDIGLGVYGVVPSPNQKILPKSEWLEQFIASSAEYNKMNVDEVRKYMGDSYECTNI